MPTHKALAWERRGGPSASGHHTSAHTPPDDTARAHRHLAGTADLNRGRGARAPPKRRECMQMLMTNACRSGCSPEVRWPAPYRGAQWLQLAGHGDGSNCRRV